MDFATLMADAEKVLGYITEGKRLAGLLVTNYNTAKETLSDSDKATLEAKLAEVEAASAATHEAIQSQE